MKIDALPALASHFISVQGGLSNKQLYTKAKDLNDSKDPKHTLICREIAFLAIYALFRDNISIL